MYIWHMNAMHEQRHNLVTLFRVASVSHNGEYYISEPVESADLAQAHANHLLQTSRVDARVQEFIPGKGWEEMDND